MLAHSLQLHVTKESIVSEAIVWAHLNGLVRRYIHHNSSVYNMLNICIIEGGQHPPPN
jgi:hypothetical protein